MGTAGQVFVQWLCMGNGNGNNHSDCLYNDLTCFWCDESVSYHKLKTHKSTVGLKVAFSYFFFDLYRKEIE